MDTRPMFSGGVECGIERLPWRTSEYCPRLCEDGRWKASFGVVFPSTRTRDPYDDKVA